MSEDSPKAEDYPEIVAATVHLAKVCSEKGVLVVGTVLVPKKDYVVSIRFGTAETFEEWRKLFHITHAEMHMNSQKMTDSKLIDLSKGDA